MLHMARAIAAGATLASLTAGCATITTGKDQKLSFDTDPAGADCTLTQSGVEIDRFRTPKALSVRRANSPLIVACSKPGYHQTRALIASTISDGAWGNLVVGGLIGVMIDQSNGAAFRYYDPPKLPMVAAGDAPPASSTEVAKGVTLLPPTTEPTPVSSGPVAVAPAGDSKDKPVVRVVAAPARPAGTLPGAGIWECGLNTGKRTYKLQFVVAADRSMIVTSYANAPVTIVQKDPLTLTAVNPRGDRPMNIVWNTDNTIEISGPSSQKPDTTFHDAGACTKV
jgi:hypothetical protein